VDILVISGERQFAATIPLDSAILLPMRQGVARFFALLVVLGDGGVYESEGRGHVGLEVVLGDAVRDGPHPIGKRNGSLGDLLLASAFVALDAVFAFGGLPGGAFDEFADVIGQAAAQEPQTFEFVALLVFFQFGKEFEAADAAFDDADGVGEEGVFGLGVHGWMMDGG